jgi:hypothetical protein
MEKNMAHDLDVKIVNLRAELTRLVRDGQDEEGLILRRMLAELERLENQRLSLRAHLAPRRDNSVGGSHAHFAA